MGLADTSPVPKKDSMGMDYIPVYEDEDSDDGADQIVARKNPAQRRASRSRVASRVIRTSIRAPGMIQLDERRVSVISMRSESWVQKVADVTTGSRVDQGPAADADLQRRRWRRPRPNTSRPSTPKPPAASRSIGRGSRQRLINLDVPEAAIAAMEKSGTAPMTIDWSAPRDGIVLERNAIEGHAGAARRRAVPRRRYSRCVGDGRRRRARPRRAGGRADA